MLNSLYIKASENKELIKSIIHSFDNVNINAFDEWNNYQIPQFSDRLTIAAGDGSLNKKSFLTCVLYAVAAESVIYSENFDKLEIIQNSEINIIRHHEHVDDSLRSFMELFEVKNSLKTYNNFEIDYYLYDGSIYGNILRFFHMKEILAEKDKQNFIKYVTKIFKKEINGELEISSVLDQLDFLKNIPSNENKDYNELLNYTIGINLLIGLFELLRKPKKLISVSKTSRSKEYFNEKIPDIAIFDKKTVKTGFSNPLNKTFTEKSKYKFPIHDDFFKNLVFTTFYVRLENKKNILKVELPYEANFDDVRNIISILNKTSINGYPYLLKKAHKDVEITSKDFNLILKILGIYNEKTGREMLI